MFGHIQIGIWEVSKITVVDSNDVVNHWLMTGAINIPTILITSIKYKAINIYSVRLLFACTGFAISVQTTAIFSATYNTDLFK